MRICAQIFSPNTFRLPKQDLLVLIDEFEEEAGIELKVRDCELFCFFCNVVSSYTKNAIVSLQ